MFQHLFVRVVLGELAIFVALGGTCRVGEYETDGQCCPLCDPGEVVKRHCTLSSSTGCKPCEEGTTYMDIVNGLTECFHCSFCPRDRGLVTKEECNKKSDTVCEASEGFYCQGYTQVSGCSSAARHRRCSPGQRLKEPGTKDADSVCEDCQPGFYSQDGVNCTVWTVCSDGQIKTKEGSPRKDVVCSRSSRHHYILALPVSLLMIGLIILGGPLKTEPGKMCGEKRKPKAHSTS